MPEQVGDAVERLGRRIRLARARQGLTQQDLAGRIGVCRHTLRQVERGDSATSMGVYAGALWALGLLDLVGDMADLDQDVEGKRE